MSITRIIGLIVIICGIGLVVAANYINDRVLQGKGQISDAQDKVNLGRNLFSLTPPTKQIGKGFTDSAQKKINAATRQVAEYEELAYWLQIGGFGCLIVGAGLLIFGKKRK